MCAPMRKLAETCEGIAATTKKLQKVAIVADYMKAQSVDDAAVAAVFLSGKPFPAWEETTLQVGGRLLWQVVREVSDSSDEEMSAAYRKLGDLGAVAGEMLAGGAGQDLTLAQTQQSFRQIAEAHGPAAKAARVRELLEHVTPPEAKYVVKIMTGDLRIGLKESLVEEAIAQAYGATLSQVQRAYMLLGDIGETVRLAARGALAQARMRMFHPLGFMLASPAESAEEALSYFEQASIEDKYDGVRAQAHVSGGDVRFFPAPGTKSPSHSRSSPMPWRGCRRMQSSMARSWRGVTPKKGWDAHCPSVPCSSGWGGRK